VTEPSAKNPLTGIALKVLSTVMFVAMASCIKAASAAVPTGELVFARAFFALLPVLAVVAWRGELQTVLTTTRPWGHLWRGLIGTSSMFAWFLALSLLPLPEAMTLSFSTPLIVVVFSALLLGEVVRVYRWSAVAAGFAGVLIMLWPRLSAGGAGGMGANELLGTAAALASASAAALAVVQVRKLLDTERSGTIVVLFSLTTTILGLMTLPFGWVVPDGREMGLLVASGLLGGVGQLLMTESYRYADVSTIATFDYTSLLWSVLIGWLVFGELVTPPVLAGGAIVIASGLFIILRERQLGRRPPPPV
jgi:drug/metabolite transporter (DMT)-like permease